MKTTTDHMVTLPDGRVVHLVDTGCDLCPKIHYVWLCQIAPVYFAVLGGSEDEAHEAAVDEIEFKGTTTMAEMLRWAKENLKDCDGDEDKAWECAIEGCLPLNGGEKWLEGDDYGFWNPDKKETRILALALDALRNPAEEEEEEEEEEET